MDPAAPSSAQQSSSFTSTPFFKTSVTSKNKHRDEIRLWIRMLNQCAKVRTKYKAICDTAGHMIYSNGDDLAQNLVQQTERVDTLNLDGEDDDVSRNQVIEKIIGIIAKDCPTKRVKREVNQLNEIQACQRKPSEAAVDFASLFNVTVARYVKNIGVLNEYTSRQFAVLMIRNACLSADTMNSVTFQLTMQGGLNKPQEPKTKVTVNSD